MIILTGGAGFIGSCVLAGLNALGREDILVVDHIADEPLKENNLKNKKYKDYLDKSVFLEKVLAQQAPQGVEAVIHMGACSSTLIQDPEYYRVNNFEYSRHLARWAMDQNIRFIYASSAATYGDGSKGYSDADEVTPALQPLNDYGKSKQDFDCWVLDNGFQHQFVGLKFFNVFGPNEYHKKDMRSLVLKAYPRAAAEGRIALFKSYNSQYRDGEQKRDFIYVKDAADVVLYFWGHRNVSGIFNVGTGRARSWNDLARALFSGIGKPGTIEYKDMPEVLRGQYQYFTEADMTKLRECGYRKPFTSLEDAVADYVTYLKDRRHL